MLPVQILQELFFNHFPSFIYGIMQICVCLLELKWLTSIFHQFLLNYLKKLMLKIQGERDNNWIDVEQQFNSCRTRIQFMLSKNEFIANKNPCYNLIWQMFVYIFVILRFFTAVWYRSPEWNRFASRVKQQRQVLLASWYGSCCCGSSTIGSRRATRRDN